MIHQVPKHLIPEFKILKENFQSISDTWEDLCDDLYKRIEQEKINSQKIIETQSNLFKRETQNAKLSLKSQTQMLEIENKQLGKTLINLKNM